MYSSFSVDSVLFLLTFFWSFCCSFLWSPFDFAPQKLPTERGCHDSRLQFCASLFFFSIKIFQCWIILWYCTMWTRKYAHNQVEERVFNKCVLLNNSLFFFSAFHIKIKLKTGFFSKTLSHLFYLIRFTHLVFWTMAYVILSLRIFLLSMKEKRYTFEITYFQDYWLKINRF